MSVLPIVLWPDPRLSQVCAPVGAVTDDIRDLAQNMLDTMYDAPGRGLAAPQVGRMLRLFVMDPTWKDGDPAPVICVDPEIIARSDDTILSEEGCLSIPGVTAQVRRAARIELAWTDLDGARHRSALEGFAALCAQHETDHLDGLVTFDRIDADQRARLIRDYESA